MSKECTLSDHELVEKIQAIVSELCKTGGRSWSLSVPVNFNRDPDILISELVTRFKKVTKPVVLKYYTEKEGGNWQKCIPPNIQKEEKMAGLLAGLPFGVSKDWPMKEPANFTKPLVALMWSDGTIFDTSKKRFRDEKHFSPEAILKYIQALDSGEAPYFTYVNFEGDGPYSFKD